jgi:hypothetical protein
VYANTLTPCAGEGEKSPSHFGGRVWDGGKRTLTGTLRQYLSSYAKTF